MRCLQLLKSGKQIDGRSGVVAIAPERFYNFALMRKIVLAEANMLLGFFQMVFKHGAVHCLHTVNKNFDFGSIVSRER